MSEPIKENVEDKSIWKRILYMLLFLFAYGAAEFVMGIVVLIQLLITLVKGSTNNRLVVFGKQVALYIYDVMLFLTFNTDEMPFPFNEWPNENRK